MPNGELRASSGVPLYRQIKEILRKEIVSGSADPVSPMTEAKLLQRFQVSRAPIRQALGELADEGYVYRKQGRGTFPASPSHVNRPAGVRAGGLHRFLDNEGMNPQSTVSPVSRTEPPAHVRSRLHSANSETVVHFSRIISVDGSPLVDASLYMRAPESFLPSSSELESSGSAFEVLERQHGISLEHTEHEVWATSADRHYADSLGVAKGSPVLAIATTFFTTGGVPAGWRLAIHKAEEFTYRFTETF